MQYQSGYLPKKYTLINQCQRSIGVPKVFRDTSDFYQSKIMRTLYLISNKNCCLIVFVNGPWSSKWNLIFEFMVHPLAQDFYPDRLIALLGR